MEDNYLMLINDDLYVMNINKDLITEQSYTFINNSVSYLRNLKTKAHKSVIIMVDGYGEVATELYEIPEVRTWVAGLFERYPYFLYFINTDLDSHITLLSCIGDIETLTVGYPTLSPMEYKRRGIDPLKLPRKQWNITLSEIQFSKLTNSLMEYGQEINDIAGAVQIVYLIKGLSNRN